MDEAYGVWKSSHVFGQVFEPGEKAIDGNFEIGQIDEHSVRQQAAQLGSRLGKLGGGIRRPDQFFDHLIRRTLERRVQRDETKNKGLARAPFCVGRHQGTRPGGRMVGLNKRGRFPGCSEDENLWR
jgi:hypothetical protein